eukprot:g1413.t1
MGLVPLARFLLAVLPLTGATASYPPVADRVGVRVAITDKGLKYAARVALPLILSDLSTISIPDVPFDQSGFTGKISSIKCADVAIDTLGLSANVAESIALAASGLSISCSADWQYKLKVWPHVPDGHGTVDISIGDGSSFSATLGISNNTGVFTSMSLPACSSGVKISSMHFHGGLTGDILNLFKSLIESAVEKEINGQVCGAVKKALVDDLNPTLAKEPANYLAATVLGKSVVCDLSFGVNSSAAGPSPVKVPMLPVPDANAAPTHELLAMFDTVPFNYLMSVVWDAGLLDLIITHDMLPSSFPNILNTSNLETIAPGMFKKWPNELVQIEVNVTQAPSFDVRVIQPKAEEQSAARVGAGTTKNTELEAVFPADLIFQVLDPMTGLNDAFTVNCPLALGVAVSVEQAGTAPGSAQTINVSIPELKCVLKEVASHVGNVSVGQLQGLVSLAEGIVVPMINAKLKNLTITIPSLGPVNLTNSEIGFETDTPGYLLVATDVVMANKTSGEAVKAQTGEAVRVLHEELMAGGRVDTIAKALWGVLVKPWFFF